MIKGNDELEIDIKPFRSLEHKKEINFKLGPRGLKIKEDTFESDRIPGMA